MEASEESRNSSKGASNSFFKDDLHIGWDEDD